MIYFDNSATTQPYKDVVETYTKVVQQYIGNPSSLHPLGRQAERLITQAREAVSSLLGVKSKEILFTSGGTEGNNLAIKGTAFRYRNRGRHLITTKVEHPSVYEAFQYLEGQGFEVTYLPVDKTGAVSVQKVKEALREDTILVSLIHVNNELGTVNPIQEVGRLLADYPKVLFHVDHVQGIGKVSLPFKGSGIDLCTVSGHKFHGLKGTGFLYLREGIWIDPLLHGGSQELRHRAGTENIAGAVSLAKALRLTLENQQNKTEKIKQLQGMIVNAVREIHGTHVNSMEDGAPHIIHFSVPGLKPEVLVQALAEEGIYVSTKSACSSKQSEPSRVLQETFRDEELAKSGIRVSLSYDNTEEEANTLITTLNRVIPELLEVVNI
ncbi:cysteine desulfurase family protein [Texcoconibacillus texcoconensis]|uniref:Cysteine desulfurase n=1 Tax=Texcoconibacillus texcoconensis TaxID=1095777 RepID=A0A840QN25_9BACI|nr:cysteine desulfurase family protein [Texcoconibacillus texcoconensis]MBB5172758.1 cysteine desulfurase [Texcoconibacillus texcoconensis]